VALKPQPGREGVDLTLKAGTVIGHQGHAPQALEIGDDDRRDGRRIDTGGTTLPVTITVCQTIPATGQCMQTPAATVSTSYISGSEEPTFGVFVSASAAVPFDPTKNRVFVTFTDSTNTIRGETSVAVETQ
jgi:hypothetical protein